MIDPDYIVTKEQREQEEFAAKVPAEISFNQLLAALEKVQWISGEEADAWFDGTLPAEVQGLIAQLPEEDRRMATYRAKRPGSVRRDDDLVNGLAALRQIEKREMDEFFIAAAAL